MYNASELKNKIENGEYRNLNYLIYNFLEDECYLQRLQNMNISNSIDDLEFSLIEKFAKKKDMKYMLSIINEIKDEIDKSIGIYILKEYNILISVRPKKN